MIKLSIFVVSTVAGYAGWLAGDFLGFSFFTNFMLSGLASVVGVYLGWKLGRKLEN